jgi:hypothetical protein
MTFEKTKDGIPIGTLNVVASGTGGKPKTYFILPS